jgi:hypothetical protein
MTYLIKISSAQRDYGSTEDFVFKLSQSIKEGETYELTSAHIPQSFHNIDSTNNAFIFNEGASDLTATIPTGYYMVTTLLTALQTVMDLAGADTYTVTHNIDQQTCTVTSTGSFSVLMASVDNACTALGFTVDTASASTHTGIDFVNIERVQSLNISINDMVEIRGKHFGSTFCIPSDVELLQVLDYKAPVSEVHRVTFTQHTPYLKVRPFTDDNVTVDLQGAAYYFMLRKVSC